MYSISFEVHSARVQF